MNEIVNKFLLGDKFMHQMHLQQLNTLDKVGFIYSTCGPFTKEFKNLKKQDIKDISTEKKLDKACF